MNCLSKSTYSNSISSRADSASPLASESSNANYEMNVIFI